MRSLICVAAAMAVSSAALAQDFAPTAPPAQQLAPGQTAADLFPALIEHSRHVARLENGRLTGEGGDFLRALGAQSQFVLIGEEHGNAGIADFVSAYWSDLNAEGFGYAAVEVDPWVASSLERELRAGGVAGWASYLERNGGATGAPFFDWQAEALLAEAIVRSTPARGPRIWGLDQVFIGAASPLLADIAAHAHDREARALAAELAAASAGDLDWLGASDAQQLIDLRAHLSGRRDSAYAELVDAMIQSQRIYRPFTGGGGEALLANIERENLMKQLFLARYRAAERADGRPPRVMFKFGAYHMYRGTTPTGPLGLGGFVTDFATANGTNALAVAVWCGPGSEVASLQGPPESCTQPFNEQAPFLAPFTDSEQITIFDLRVWKFRMSRWRHLPSEMRQLLMSFDVLVIVPNAAASQFLPGLSPPAPPS
ncbi:MAG: hypothetical protein R3C25_01785 [Hyphomonadaceae bacterium]